jgi:hypothetical protein
MERLVVLLAVNGRVGPVKWRQLIYSAQHD